MNIFILLLLCIVQGLTEFLPVSSSGHLLLIEQLFGIKDNLIALNLFLHLATLLAVIIIYRKIIIKLLKKPFQPLTLKLLISTVITCTIALVFKLSSFEDYLTKIYGFCFIITAILLITVYFYQKKAATIHIGEIGYKSSIITGIVQGFAILPGISRSGSTISTMLFCGNDESSATEFSFLLSIPIILGGFLLEMLKIDNWSIIFNNLSPFFYFLGFMVTFAVSIISLKLTIKLFKKHKFIYFAIYLFIIGLFVILYNFFF